MEVKKSFVILNNFRCVQSGQSGKMSFIQIHFYYFVSPLHTKLLFFRYVSP